jgi:DNA-binding transcriptional LysR family regulator
LRYFVTVAETGNLSRAAAQLHVAQPALSRQVRDLERELGVPLLARHPKGVTPTLAGESFARGAAQALAETAAALDRAEATAAGRRGRVAIGAHRAVIARGFIAQLQDALRHQHPEIAVVVEELDFRRVIDELASGRVDLAITIAPDPRPVALTTTPLWEETADRALLPTRHRLARRSRVSVADLGELPFVLANLGYPASLVGRALGALRARGLRSPLLVVDGGFHAALVAVAAGRGWTLESQSLGAAPPQGTTVVPLEGVAVQVLASAVWRAGERRPAIRTVLEAACDVARRYPDTRTPAVPRLPPRPPARSGGRRPPGFLPPAFEIRHLRALLGVAATQTIGRAAQRLGVTQPALSRQLQELEHALGLVLLERSARGVNLTSAGSALAGDGPALLLAIERLARDAARARRGMEGRCVIGAVATAVTSELLTTLLTDCAQRHPHVQIAIEDMPTPRQLPALARGEIDLGLAHAYVELGDCTGYEQYRLVDDRVQYALLSTSHPLARRRALAPADLADVPLLFIARVFYPPLYDRVMAALAAIGLKPRVDGTHDGLHTVWALAAQGKGWGLGFRSHRQRPPVGTVAVPITGLDLPWGIDLISREREPNPAVRVVVDLLQNARRRHPRNGNGRPRHRKER